MTNDDYDDYIRTSKLTPFIYIYHHSPIKIGCGQIISVKLASIIIAFVLVGNVIIGRKFIAFLNIKRAFFHRV